MGLMDQVDCCYRMMIELLPGGDTSQAVPTSSTGGMVETLQTASNATSHVPGDQRLKTLGGSRGGGETAA